MAPQARLVARLDDDSYYNFWYSTAGYAVRWSIFGLFVLIILLWVVGGYFHAKHLMKKGLPLNASSPDNRACNRPGGTVRRATAARTATT
ncbi:hypothetical protein NLG97_g9228 [Lecanicillium saksenae]|uniref:Uncharacterized protein n=1 Tax=Lecanicillium saksenae TaxID=468837 RepID=A0ACC1QIG4_9HYPO|nr:hypothetical protein NLG97_g9228 [Lecanicillium saksenae]